MKLPDHMYSDTFFVIKKDGRRTGPFRGVYGNGRMATQDASPDIEDGDTIARIVGKREEIYEVTDSSYSPGHPGVMEPFYNPFLRKSTAPAPSPQSVTNFHTVIHGGTGIQVGQHNTMDVKAPVQNPSKGIEDSTAMPDKKQEE